MLKEYITINICHFYCVLGGAISNLYGVLTARHYACPDIKEKGLLGMKQIVLFASEQVCRDFISFLIVI